MTVDNEAREEALQRLRSVEGHIRGIQRMLEEDCGCVELIHQTLAVKRALDKVSRLLVSSHMRGCLAAEGGSCLAAERERALQELWQVLELSGRL